MDDVTVACEVASVLPIGKGQNDQQRDYRNGDVVKNFVTPEHVAWHPLLNNFGRRETNLGQVRSIAREGCRPHRYKPSGSHWRAYFSCLTSNLIAACCGSFISARCFPTSSRIAPIF